MFYIFGEGDRLHQLPAVQYLIQYARLFLSQLYERRKREFDRTN